MSTTVFIGASIFLLSLLLSPSKSLTKYQRAVDYSVVQMDKIHVDPPNSFSNKQPSPYLPSDLQEDVSVASQSVRKKPSPPVFVDDNDGSTRYKPTWTSLDNRPLPKWFDEAKIGIFIHWGVFSVPSYGNEWFWYNWKGKHDNEEAHGRYLTPRIWKMINSTTQYMKRNYRPDFDYQDFAPMFTAELFNATQWAEVFHAAGARYVVLTSKHHEGFTLWPSPVSWNWNAKDIGPNRDLVGELADAVRKYDNLHFGLYHSLFEWFNPLLKSDEASHFNKSDFVDRKTLPELYELVKTYKPEVIWSDGDQVASPEYWRSQEFMAWLYNDSPVKDTVVINDRLGNGTSMKHGDFFSGYDRFSPGKLMTHKWENAMTLDFTSWGYNRLARAKDYYHMRDLLLLLFQTVSCGGNILINVGPTADGRLPPIMEERLLQLGQWLTVNGEAVYSSKPFLYQNDSLTKDIWYTSKRNNVYAFFQDWPLSSQLYLGSMGSFKGQSISRAVILGIPQELVFKLVPDKYLLITLPPFNPSTAPSFDAWVIRLTLT